MNGLGDIHGVAVHFDSERQFADEVAGMRAYNAATDHAVCFRVEQDLREPLIPAVRNRAAGGCPWK